MYTKSNLTIRRAFELEIEITENDIFNWLTNCDDTEILTRLGHTCLKYAQGIRAQESDDDDFRSRA